MNQDTPQKTMTLTPRQRKTLRQQAQTLKDDLHLGKAGLSAGFIAQAGDIFTRRELIKVRLGKDIEGEARAAVAEELAGAVSAQMVAVVGKTVLLYRPKSGG